MYRDLPFREREQDWQSMRRYNYLIVEEALQLAYEDSMPMFNCIGYSAYPHEINSLKTMVFGEPYQPPLKNESQLPGIYYNTNNYPFLEHINPK